MKYVNAPTSPVPNGLIDHVPADTRSRAANSCSSTIQAHNHLALDACSPAKRLPSDHLGVVPTSMGPIRLAQTSYRAVDATSSSPGIQVVAGCPIRGTR